MILFNLFTVGFKEGGNEEVICVYELVIPGPIFCLPSIFHILRDFCLWDSRVVSDPEKLFC